MGFLRDRSYAKSGPTKIARFSWELGASEVKSTGPQNIPRVEQIAGLLELVQLLMNPHRRGKEFVGGIKFLGQKC